VNNYVDDALMVASDIATIKQALAVVIEAIFVVFGLPKTEGCRCNS